MRTLWSVYMICLLESTITDSLGEKLVFGEKNNKSKINKNSVKRKENSYIIGKR